MGAASRRRGCFRTMPGSCSMHNLVIGESRIPASQLALQRTSASRCKIIIACGR